MEAAGQRTVTRDLKDESGVQQQDRGATDKRRQIMDGASQMFLDQGFDAASMGAIARAAGVSKGTLYVYFKSKEELFEAIVEEQRRHQAENIFTLDETADVAVELRRLGIEFATFLCRPEGVSPLRTVIAIADRMPDLGGRFYQSGPAFAIEKLKTYLDQKVSARALRPHDTEVAAAQFIDSCVSLNFKRMLFNFGPSPSTQQIERVVDIAVSTYLAAYSK